MVGRSREQRLGSHNGKRQTNRKRLRMITIILNFIEENWEAFRIYCKYNGITDTKEIEKELDKIKRRIRR